MRCYINAQAIMRVDFRWMLISNDISCVCEVPFSITLGSMIGSTLL
jgi:hypothetical protein